MSSPAKPPSGPNSTTPSNTAATAPRKRPPVNIFNTQRKKPTRKPAPASQSKAPVGQTSNGAQNQAKAPVTNGTIAPSLPTNRDDFQEFPIYVSKDALVKGLHYHAMKLQSKPDSNGNLVHVSPYDEGQFTRPLRLHRRNARDKMEVAEMSDAASGMDDKEKEMISIKRAERQAEREANQALIAPTGGDSKKPVKKKPQKKVEDVYYDENNPQQRQRAQLRYEEARPWHLEDFEAKNIWVGSYEEPMSDTCVMFEIGEHGFRMIPVEKWYRFTQTNRFKVMDSDEVEKHMARKVKAPRWFLGTQEANDDARRQAAAQQREQARAQMRRFEDDDAFVKKEDYQADVDEIDFEFNDEFQDDDEGMIFGEQADDDTKEIEKRIREEQRGANLAGTGVKDEDRDWDEEEQQEKKAEQEEKRRTKRLRKQLIRKERKNEYDSASSHGEFSESSDTEDSEEERERLEEEKKKEEEAKKLNGDKSGASTKGTNTPTGRSEKKDNSKLGASLKRPGSPDLSELSGNESSRKKAKSVNGRAVSTSAPNGGARSLSPDAAKTHRADSGSDTDTSRTGRPKIRIKNSNSPTGTPSASGSRAQSPQRKPVTTGAFPTLEEVKAAIPAGGIAITELAQMFKPRVLARQADFIALVKQAGKQDPATKKIMPKPGAAGAAAAASPGEME